MTRPDPLGDPPGSSCPHITGRSSRQFVSGQVDESCPQDLVRETGLSTDLLDAACLSLLGDILERMFEQEPVERRCSFPGCKTALLRQGAVSVTLPAATARAAATSDPSPIIGSSKLRFRRLRQASRQPRLLPGPCQAAPEGSTVTSPPAVLWQEGPLPIRRLRKAPRSGRLLRRTRCPVLQWAPAGSTLEAQGGM